jgi:hypothetical protein
MNKFFTFAALAAITVFSSCTKKDDAAPAKVLPNSYTAKLLGAQLNPAGSFFSASNGTVYGTADSANFAANKVDFSFAQIGAAFTPKLISLDERKNEGLSKVVSVNRNTDFILTAITKAQFDTASNAFVSDYTGGVSSKAIAIAQGNIYAFSTTEGKIGFIYVSNLDKGTGTNGSVTIDVKVEK